MCPLSIKLLCTWHRSENFKKKFLFLNRKNLKEKELYLKIDNLPYEESVEKFEESYALILSNTNLLLKEQDLKYLEEYYNKKEQWCKGYMIHKKYFTCGICTTQRVESMHATFTKLTLKSSLQELLKVLKESVHKTND